MKKPLRPGLFAAVCFAVTFLSVSSLAQYGPNDYVLSTQAEVDAFNPSVLQGKNLVVSGSNITNINRLSNVIKVNGLTIENNPLLTSLTPLNSLDSVGILRIAGNPGITTIDGFTSLHSSAGVVIANNSSLTSIAGLNAMSFPTGESWPLTVENNAELLTISGFNALQKATQITINNNGKLTAVTGFHQLTSARTNTLITRYPSGRIAITNNPELIDLDGFLALLEFDFLELTGNAKLKNINGFSNVVTMYGNGINISNNAALENLDGFTNTTAFSYYQISNTAHAWLDHNPMLTKPCGIYKILNKLDYLINVERVHIEGSGFHMYQLLECGPTRITIPPAPLIALDFDQLDGLAPVNSGALDATFSRSANTPTTSNNVPGTAGGTNSFDYGTTPGNYFVESSTAINGLKNLGEFTITGWLNNKSSTTGAGGNRVVSWTNNGGDGVDLVYQTNGSLRLGVDGLADNSPAFSSAGKVPTSASGAAGNWRFFAVTYKSDGQVQFYFGNTTTDATLDVTRTYTGPGVTGSSIGKLAVGALNDASRNANTYDRMFRGLIDEVQIFGSVLNLEKILAVQHAVGAPSPSKPFPILVSKTATSVNLEWAASTGSLYYGYYVRTYKDGVLLNNSATITGTNTLSAVITGLAPATTYGFVVGVSDQYGETDPINSDPLIVTTNAASSTLRLEAELFNGASGVVKQATTVESTDAQDWIRFDNVNLGSGYTTITTRYAKGNSGNGIATVRIGNPTSGTVLGTITAPYTGGWATFATTSAPLTGAGGTQTIYVSWPSGAGNGNYDWFEFGGGNSGDTNPPTAPSNLKVVSQTASSATLSWGASADNTGVTLYEVFNNQTQLVGTSTTTSITLNSLAPQTYIFRVRARDAAGNYSGFSNNLAVTPGTMATLHIEAESYNGANGIANQTTTVGSTDAQDWIRFDNVNLGSGYSTITARYAKGNNVNGSATVRLNNPTTGTLIGTINTMYTGGWGTYTTASAPLTGASGLQTVYVSFPSGEGNGNFDWFEFSGGSTDTNPPSTPGNVYVVSKTSTSITLSWTASTDNVGVTRYEVYRNSTSLLGSTNTPSIIINNLTPNTTYALSVRAGDAANNYSPLSIPLNVTTNAPATLHLEAESFSASSGIVRQTNTVESTDANDWIRFDNVNFGNGYVTIVARYAKGNNIGGTATVRTGNPTNGPLIATITTNYTGGWGTFATASASLTGLSGTQTIYVSWPSGEGNGNYDWFEFNNQSLPSSARENISIALATPAIEEDEFANELYQNFPNPFAGETEIGVSLNYNVKVARITVRDITGRSLHDVEVVERGKTSVKFTAHALNAGVYFYSLMVDGKVVDVKRMVLTQ